MATKMKQFCLMDLDTGKTIIKNNGLKVIFSNRIDIEKIKEYCLMEKVIDESHRLEIVPESNKQLNKVLEDNGYGKKFFKTYEDFIKFITA